MNVPRAVRGGAAALALPVAATVAGRAFQPSGEIAASLYILAVVAAAAVGGLWSGLVASVASFLGLNYFFTPPRGTFRVDKEEDLVALVVFLIVAGVVAALLARAIEERSRAARREREARLLQYSATKLLAAEPLERRLEDLTAALAQALELARCEIEATLGRERISARAALEGREGAEAAFPIEAGGRRLGTLRAVRRAEAGPLSPDDERLLRACAGQVAITLERVRLDAETEAAKLASEVNQLRAALFSSVTHDLRTPLASIKASVTSLLGGGLDPDRERELLGAVLEETDRLNRLVGNIVDLARIRSGALVPAKERSSVEEVLASVLHRLEPALASVRVRTLTRPDLPDVMIDPVQIDQVLTNVLENAIRFSPPGGEIQIVLAPWRDGVQIRVTDQGPGVPPEERELVFEPFYRGAGARGGSGLGLAIARAIVLAHGGRIRMEGAPTGGAAVVVELPADAPPIAQEPAT
ncbi:Sensor protein KdpD [bacterium HR12]|nr:Sensor protein KdpD [bacterium HR12]